MYKLLFKNQVDTKRLYNIIKETKNFVTLHKEGERYFLKVSKKSYRVWVIDSEGEQGTFETAEANYLEKI